MSRRWLRLDAQWDDSEWIITLEPLAQLAWVKLLCYAKRDGRKGTVSALADIAAAKKWNIPVASIRRMLAAAQGDGALVVIQKERRTQWVVANWSEYQEPDPTAAKRMREYRQRQAESDTVVTPLRRNGA